MNQVEIKVCINAEDQSQVQALNVFLTAIGSGESKPVSEQPAKADTKKPKAETKKEEVAQAPETKVEPKAEPEVAETKKESGIKIEEVRALLAKKVQDNREEIKTKLTELGANNVTSLTSDKYPEFVTFLNGLK